MRPADEGTTLAVHCAPSLASQWLSPRLPRWIEAHPSWTLRFSSGAEPVDLQRRLDLDLLIGYGPPQPRPGLWVESLGSERIVPLASPRLLGAHPPREPGDLLRHPWIESQLNPVTWGEWCRLHGIDPPARTAATFDRGAMAVAAAVDGLGIALETRRFAEAEIERGELIPIEGPGFLSIERDLHHLSMRTAAVPRRPAQAFIRWLRSQA